MFQNLKEYFDGIWKGAEKCELPERKVFECYDHDYLVNAFESSYLRHYQEISTFLAGNQYNISGRFSRAISTCFTFYWSNFRKVKNTAEGNVNLIPSQNTLEAPLPKNTYVMFNHFLCDFDRNWAREIHTYN